MYYVYILTSVQREKRYIGTTADLVKRIKEHNHGSTTTTKLYRPYKLIWYCAFLQKQQAYQFEKYLKSGSGHAFMNKHLV